MFNDNTYLNRSETKRLIRELNADADFMLANLCTFANAHEVLDEIYQLIEFYETKLCSLSCPCIVAVKYAYHKED